MTPEVPEPRTTRRPLAGLSLAVLLVALVAVALGTGGCTKPPKPVNSDGPESGPKGNPWKAAGARLKKETDLTATKSVLGALTSETNQGNEKLPAHSDVTIAQIAALVPLSPEDREEVRGAAFTSHDPVYLADCLYLRDAARSLALAGLPPEKQAELAFAWVCRQVYLHPWVWHLGGNHYQPTALPPTAVLRRGFGSGLERMYVFLALLQQLELDGCLIGGPNSGAKEACDPDHWIAYPSSPQVKAPRGPFWAAGVRVGTDVRLFDPWRGVPFPVTLNQVKANPDAHKSWFEDKANLSGATLDDAKKATAFLAVPVSALSARMAAFEANLKGELGVKVAYDLKALEAMRAAYPDPKPAFWNTEYPYDYGRVARSFLPRDMGGTDGHPPGTRLYDASLREQIPPSAFRPPGGLEDNPAAAMRLRGDAAGRLGGSFLEPPTPRERIQRGQFLEAAKDLVAKQEAFATGLERLRTQDPAQQAQLIRDWIESANALYADLTKAQSLTKDKQAEAEALKKIEEHWRQPGAVLLIDKASAEVGRAEASLLLALCKHEQAERLQARLERATGPDAERLKVDALDAWKTALGAWRTYEQLSSAHANFPGRAAHARTLSERAAKFAEPEAKK